MLVEANKLVFLVVIVVIIIFFLLFKVADAAWEGPSQLPPNGNIAAPLNIETIFQGDVKGMYDNLRIQIEDCSPAQLLIWDGENVRCADINSQVGLLNVLNAGADASDYSGGVIIGVSSSTWLDLGGALNVGWIHSNLPGNNSLAGNLGIGIENPNSQLHIYDLEKNAEINLQSLEGEGNHWAIYHGAETDDLRFWNQETGDLMVLGSDKSLGINGSLLLSNFIPENPANKLYNSQGSLYWNGARIGMGVYVGKSDEVSDGDVDGYVEANKLCNSTFSGSRVCFNFEMVNSITSNVQALKNETGVAWLMTGAAGNIFGAANDCNAFQSTNYSDYGTIWAFDVGEWGSGFVSQCNFGYNFACCK